MNNKPAHTAIAKLSLKATNWYKAPGAKRRKSKGQPNGLVVYRGPSLLEPTKTIVGIVTGLNKATVNAKTGNMLQLWIMLDDEAPHLAVDSGTDSAVCGSCKHRKTGNMYGEASSSGASLGTCYVKTFQAPLSVWRAYKSGNYPASSASLGAVDYSWAKGRKVRLGAYGDPAALPLALLKGIVAAAEGYTGYTHEWQNLNSTRLASEWSALLMASADTDSEETEAKASGWRSFRVLSDLSQLQNDSILCPATAEGSASSLSNCAKCGLCNGTSSKSYKSIAVVVHGAGANKFKKAQDAELV